jgi:molybdopterin synthase catalytic subunit
MIRVRARLFAMQREVAGTNRLELELPDDADIETVWDALVERFPELAPGRASLRFARNAAYADPSEPLLDGDEVAFIPPVSGGSGEEGSSGEDGRSGEEGRSGEDGATTPDAIIRIIEIREEPFGSELIAELGDRLATAGDGAIVAFVGRTRVTPGTPAPGQEAEAARHADRTVDALDYEAHETMAMRVLDAIADEIAARFGVERLAVVHRVGRVALGGVSIVVVAASPHRDAAFDAARYAIDETKARVPIWKAERFADGHVWIGAPPRSGPKEDGAPLRPGKPQSHPEAEGGR